MRLLGSDSAKDFGGDERQILARLKIENAALPILKHILI